MSYVTCVSSVSVGYTNGRMNVMSYNGVSLLVKAMRKLSNAHHNVCGRLQAKPGLRYLGTEASSDVDRKGKWLTL